MPFLKSLADALIDLPPDRLITGLFALVALAVLASGLYERWRKRVSNNPVHLTIAFLAVGLVSLLVGLGFERWAILGQLGKYAQGESHDPKPIAAFPRPFPVHALYSSDRNADGTLSADEFRTLVEWLRRDEESIWGMGLQGPRRLGPDRDRRRPASPGGEPGENGSDTGLNRPAEPTS